MPLQHFESSCRLQAQRPAGGFNSLPGGHSEREPPDPISNSEVKTLSADDSVGDPMRK
jgi:hypothetical protein